MSGELLMTEVEVGNAEQHNNDHAGAEPGYSAGQLLRQAREQRQMSLQSLASALKVPAYKLQALEEDRWDVLTDSVFTRSLALSVCRVLKVPSDAILAGLPKHEAAKLAANPEGINAPFKEKTLRSLMSSTPESNTGSAAKLAVALLIAIAGGIGLYFLPQWQSESEDAAEAVVQGITERALPESVAAAAEPVQAPEVATSAADAVQAAAASDASSHNPSAEAAIAAVTGADATNGAATSPATATNAAETAPAAVVPAPAGGSVLRFAATGESWVQVRDAQQRVVMEKILKSGDVLESTVAGRPLHIVVGNASATNLQIDGAAFDLVGSAKNNVARFEVK